MNPNLKNLKKFYLNLLSYFTDLKIMCNGIDILKLSA